MSILGPDGKPARRYGSGVALSCLVSGKRTNVELVKMNRKTCWVRVAPTAVRRSKVIKRHLVKHGVSA